MSRSASSLVSIETCKTSFRFRRAGRPIPNDSSLSTLVFQGCILSLIVLLTPQTPVSCYSIHSLFDCRTLGLDPLTRSTFGISNAINTAGSFIVKRKEKVEIPHYSDASLNPLLGEPLRLQLRVEVDTYPENMISNQRRRG